MRPEIRFRVVGVAIVAVLVGLFFTLCERRVQEVNRGYRGEALRNPYYGAQRFLETMGADVTFASEDDALSFPDSGTIWVLALDRSLDVDTSLLIDWAESGGHLYLLRGNATNPDSEYEVLDALGIFFFESPSDRAITEVVISGSEPLEVAFESDGRVDTHDGEATARIEDESGSYALSLEYGDGRITLLAVDTPFRHPEIGQFDHAEFLWRFVGADQEERPILWSYGGSGIASPSLLTLLFRHAGALMASLAALIAAWLWQSAVRFGPIAPDPPPARRRLLEHIEAMGRFAWRKDHGQYLVESMRVRLDREMLRRHPDWRHLDSADREARFTELVSMPPAAIARALHDRDLKDAERFRERVLQLEKMRKAL